MFVFNQTTQIESNKMRKCTQILNIPLANVFDCIINLMNLLKSFGLNIPRGKLENICIISVNRVKIWNSVSHIWVDYINIKISKIAWVTSFGHRLPPFDPIFSFF